MAEIVIKLVNGELAGKTMQEVNKNVREANKELQKAKIGTDEFVKATKKLDDAKKMQGDLKKQIEGTVSASDMLKKAWNQLPGAGFFNQIAESFGMARQGVGGLVSSMGVLKTAIISTGIGALIVVLGSLVTWMQKTDEGATAMSGAMNAASNVVDVFANRLINIGQTLKDHFTNPGKFFMELAEDIGEAAKEGWELAQVFDELDEKRRSMELVDATTQQQVEQLLLQAKNVEESYTKRISLLDQAGQIETQQHEAKLKYSQEMLAAIQRETDFQVKQGTVSDEQLDKLNQAKIAVINVERESINVQEKIENRRAQLREKNEAEAEKARQKELKRQEEALKAEEERVKAQEKAWAEYYNNLNNLQDMQVQAMAVSRQKDLSQLKLNLQRQIEAIDEHAPFYAERVAAAQELARQKRDEINKTWDARDIADQQAKLELDLETDLNHSQERFLANQITDQQYAEEVAQRTFQYEQARLDVIRTAHGEESKEYQRAYAEFLEHKRRYAEETTAATAEIAAREAAALEGTLGVTAGIMGSMASMYEQGTAQYKAFATAQAVVSTIQGAINAYTSASAIPIVGSVLAPIAAAAALAAGMAQVKKIQNTKVPAPVKREKAERGRILRGPSHAHGGIDIEAEGEEIILTKGVYRDPELRQIASDINVAAGGAKFAAGGPVNPFTDRPPVRRNYSSSSASTSSSETAELLAEVRAMRAGMDAWPTKLKVVNVATETDDVIKTVNQIKDDADV
ncbi:MAG TPA: hypothetical protein VGK59_10970 [Ohtaekwangia sp.]